MALDILSISIKLYLARLSFVAKRNPSFGLHKPDELLRQLVEANVTVSLVVDQGPNLKSLWDTLAEVQALAAVTSVLRPRT